jgi:branched-chain amino acid transport system substrate-binding protein
MRRISQTIRSFAAGAVVVLAAGAAQAADPIKIGTILSTTGPAAFLGEPGRKTMELEVARLNASGGVLGRKVEMVFYDDGGAPDRAISFVKRLIENDRVDILIGASTTATTMAVVPMVEQAEIPFISNAGAVAIVNPVKKWVFKVPHTDRMMAEKVFVDMKSRGLTKVALLSEDSAFGKSGRDQILAAAPGFGIQIVSDQIYGAKDLDMTPQLTKIRGNPNAQALIIWGLGQGPAIASRNYKQLGLTLPTYQSGGVASKDFIAMAGAAAEGMRLPSTTAVVADKLPESDRQAPVVKDYQRRYEAQYKEAVSAFGANAFDAVLIFADAAKRAGSMDKARIRDAIEQTHDLVGANGIFNVSEADHNGLSYESLRMLEIVNGDWRIIN